MLKYLEGLSKKESIITYEGKNVDIYELDISRDEKILDEWAKHFRRQYCDDVSLSKLVEGTGMSKQEWLLTYKFPSDRIRPGPSTRAGDFGEILISDYIQYIHSYYVPTRIKYSNKINPNTSQQGSDVIGLKMEQEESINDELYVIEVKTKASNSNEKENRLQSAINDSIKDTERQSITLSAMRQRLIELNKEDESKIVQRFQNWADRPFKTKYGATAIYTTEMLDLEKVQQINMPAEKDYIDLFIVYADNLMDFIHELYRRASTC